MRDKNDNGGPAFPLQSIGPNFAPGYSGMTLRDYFAASVIGHLIVSPVRQENTTQQDANFAYVVADEMLKARSK